MPAAAECAQAHRALAPDTPAKLGWRWRTDIHIAHMDTFLHPAAARSTHNAQFAGIHATRIPNLTSDAFNSLSMFNDSATIFVVDKFILKYVSSV